MDKIENHKLSLFISQRIDEILTLTGFNLIELANFTGIPFNSLREYHMKIRSISVATANELASAFAISLSYFFDPLRPLDIDLTHLPNFLASYPLGYIPQFEERAKKKEIKPLSKFRQQRQLITNILVDTNYLSVPRTIHQIVFDLNKDYSLDITPQRLNPLLKKLVVHEVIEASLVPRIYGIGYIRQLRSYLYVKNYRT